MTKVPRPASKPPVVSRPKQKPKPVFPMQRDAGLKYKPNRSQPRRGR